MTVFLSILPYLFTVLGFAITIGLYKAKVEDLILKTKDLPEWKSSVDVRIKVCEQNDLSQSELLQRINDNLIKISTQVNLLLDDKIKTGTK